jgi:hypothetical protein
MLDIDPALTMCLEDQLAAAHPLNCIKPRTLKLVAENHLGSFGQSSHESVRKAVRVALCDPHDLCARTDAIEQRRSDCGLTSGDNQDVSSRGECKLPFRRQDGWPTDEATVGSVAIVNQQAARRVGAWYD